MSSITFYTGERPIDPVVVTVTDRSLAGLTPSLVGDAGLPAHTLAIYDSDAGQVSIRFTEPFTAPGAYSIQVKLTNVDGQSDITDPFTVRVLDLADVSTGLVSVGEVEGYTDSSVTTGNIMRAQALISLAVGRNLSDTVWYATLRPNDQFWLKMAVAYQAAAMADENASPVKIPYAPGVSSMSTGDQSISFDTSSDRGQLPGLAANAAIALRRLSWMQPMRSTQAKPFLSGRGPAPDPWVLQYRVSM